MFLLKQYKFLFRFIKSSTQTYPQPNYMRPPPPPRTHLTSSQSFGFWTKTPYQKCQQNNIAQPKMPKRSYVQQNYPQQIPLSPQVPRYNVQTQIVQLNNSPFNELRYNSHPSQLANNHPVNFKKLPSNALSQSGILQANTIKPQNKTFSKKVFSEQDSLKKPQSYLPDIQLASKCKSDVM